MRRAVELAHDERQALALGQAADLGDDVGEQRALGGPQRRVGVHVGAGVVELLEVRGDALRPPQVVHRPVADDHVQPRLEVHLVGRGAQAGERPDERVLDDVLGVVARAAQQAAGEGDEALAVAVVDGGERVVAAGADEGDEAFVAEAEVRQAEGMTGESPRA